MGVGVGVWGWVVVCVFFFFFGGGGVHGGPLWPTAYMGNVVAV